MRLLAGILAGQPFSSVLTGHEQLLRRPMGRVVEPLCIMGAQIEASAGRAPLVIVGRQLQARQHRLSVASAQVKSSILLAGLYADGRTTVVQPGPARDHTERMLAWMDVDVEIAGLEVALSPPARLSSVALQVPGDISLAAFPMVASVLVPGSEVTITGVGLNPTRTGLLDALQSMGAWVNVRNRCQAGNEPVADLTVRAAALEGVSIAGDTVVRMIDEFPILAVAATQAEGTTTVQDAAELRVKETDRIATVVAELRKMGACIDSQPDGFVISGPTPLHGALVNSHGDHRLAMALAIAGLIAEGQTLIENTACIADSFPGFEGCMRNVGASYD
jgi:3-phosphoshikimate 1-carboxyvinyltransferase